MNRILKCDQYLITQYFGGKNNHKGIDIVGRKNGVSITCPIIAHSDGQVVWVQTGQKHNPNAKPNTNATYGNAVKIKHSDGYYTLYAHMRDVYVKKGQWVKQGQEIGYMGDTGRADGFHLHWEVRKSNETRINPLPYLKADLPNMKKDLYYQTYDNKKNYWLPEVKIGSNDYAGNPGNLMDAFKVQNAIIIAHDYNKRKWLPEVRSYNEYAGNIGNKIDAVAVKSSDPNVKLEYRVQLQKNKRWLPWVTGYDIKDSRNGYAGNIGEPICCIQIRKK